MTATTKIELSPRLHRHRAEILQAETPGQSTQVRKTRRSRQPRLRTAGSPTSRPLPRSRTRSYSTSNQVCQRDGSLAGPAAARSTTSMRSLGQASGCSRTKRLSDLTRRPRSLVRDLMLSQPRRSLPCRSLPVQLRARRKPQTSKQIGAIRKATQFILLASRCWGKPRLPSGPSQRHPQDAPRSMTSPPSRPVRRLSLCQETLITAPPNPTVVRRPWKTTVGVDLVQLDPQFRRMIAGHDPTPLVLQPKYPRLIH